MHSSPNEKFITTKEAGELSGYTQDYLARLVRAGEIEGKKIGHQWMVDRVALESFLQKQKNRKVLRARELADVRANEYRKLQKNTEPRDESILTMQMVVSPYRLAIGTPVRGTRTVSLVTALLVVALGALGARAEALSSFTNQVAALAQETALGFTETFGDVPSRIATRVDTSRGAMREISSRVMAASPEASAYRALSAGNVLASMQTSLVREYSAESPEVHKTFAATPVARSTISFAAIRASLIRTIAFVTTPSEIAAAMTSSLPTRQSVIDAMGGTALAIGADTRDALAQVPHLAFASGRGVARAIAALSQSAIRTDVRVMYALADTVSSGVRGAPSLAEAVFDVEYSGAMHFVRATDAITRGYLASVDQTGRAAYATSAAVGRAAVAVPVLIARSPSVVQDAALGLLGKTALVLESFPSASRLAAVITSVPALTLGERAALGTYTTIRDFFDSTRGALATFFVHSPTVLVIAPDRPIYSATTTSKTAAPIITPRPTILALAPAPVSARVVNSYPTYTTIVKGVSPDLLTQSLASLRTDVLATVAGMMQPVAAQTVTNMTTIQQVNMIQDLSNLIVRNGDFRGGSLTGGGLVSATTGKFDNLFIGSTDIASYLSSFSNAGQITSGHFVATSSLASVFPYASTTALTVSGSTWLSGLANAPLLGTNANGKLVAVATSSLGITSAVWGNITGVLANQTDLQSALNAKLSLANWYATTTDGLKEGNTNLYYTDARARAALSTSGPLAYNSGAGAFSIAQAGNSSNGFLSSIDWNDFNSRLSTTTLGLFNKDFFFSTTSTNYWLTNKSTTNLAEGANLYYTDARARAALSTSGPLSYNSGTGAFSIASGYIIPLIASTTNWNGSYDTVAANSTNWNSAYAGWNANSANWDTAYASRITLATAPLSFAGNVLSLAQASSTANGYLSSTDWNIFNSKVSSPWATSGADISYIAGNVGIGTAAPAYKLDVAGTARFTNSLALSSITSCTGTQALQTDGSGNVSCGLINTSGASVGGGWASDATKHTVSLATSTYLVAVGATSTLYAKFAVISGSVATTTLALVPSASQTAHIIDIYNTSGALSSVLTADDRLGIGTTTPWATLSVNAPAGRLSFAIGSSTKTSFVVDKNGYVGVGTPMPSSLLTVAANALGVIQTNSSGLAIENMTAASAGAQQISPSLRFTGQGWATTPVASQRTDWQMYALPVQGSANPTSNLIFASGVNGGAYTTRFTLTSGGALSSISSLAMTNTLTNTRTALAAVSTDGIILTNTTAATAGATVQMSPRLRLSGTVWDTGAAASRTVNFKNEVLPVSGNPGTARMLWGYDYNAGGYSELMSLVSTGLLGIGTTTPGSLLSLGNTGANTINISNVATSTFGYGINLKKGCYAINGVCVAANALTAVAVSAPLTGNGTSGSPLTIAQSNGTTDGYLAQADWSHFNTAYTSRIVSATLPLTISANTVAMTQANTSTNGWLSSTDWNTFNTKDSFAWPFTPTAWGVSTSTTIGFTNGIIASASSTIGSLNILANGNVGVGTSPTQKLDVAGYVNTDQYSGFKQAGNTVLYASTTNSSLAIGASSAANWMRATSTLFYDVAIGQGALQTVPTNGLSQFNVAVGFSALGANTSGKINNAFGYGALALNTTGNTNSAFGFNTLRFNTTGNSNSAYGNNALYSNITGNNNSAFGYFALRYNTSATSSVAIGHQAGQGTAAYSNTGGTYVGFQSGYVLATGSNYNTLVGYQSGFSITSGARNTFLGNSTIAASQNQVTTGSNNISIGNDVAVPSATASNQLNIGNMIYGTGLSGTGATVSTGNIGIGLTAPAYKLDVAGYVNTDQYSGFKQAGNTVLYASTTNFSLALGTTGAAGWMRATSTLFYDIAIGQGALGTTPTNGTASTNTAVGVNALNVNRTGNSNTVLGAFTLPVLTTGNSNTALGRSVLNTNITGSFNTAVGSFALRYNTSASSSVAVGYNAGGGTAAYSNQGGTYLGYQAGYSAQTNSNYNTLVGYLSGYSITSGARNTFLGNSVIAASQNQVTTGSNNISIGNDVAVPSATASNQLNIGNMIYGTGLSGTGATVSTGNIGIGTTSPWRKLSVAGSMAIDSPTVSTTGDYLCWNTVTHEIEAGTTCTLSSEKFKTNIVPLSSVSGLDEVLALKPVSFTFIKGYGDNGATTQLGFIAEQAALVDSRLVTRDEQGNPNGFVYANFTSVLTKAIQQLDAKLDVPAGATSTPLAVLTADGRQVDLYKLATYAVANVSLLAGKIDAQGTRLTSLEARVAKLESGAVSVASASPLALGTTSLASALQGFGVLIEKGIAQFNTLVFRQIVASKDADGTSSAGSVSIITGNTVAQVQNSLVLPSTKVFVTFNSQISGSWWVADKTAGSFRVVLSAPQTIDVSFDYFLVQTEGQLATSTPNTLGTSASAPAPVVIAPVASSTPQGGAASGASGVSATSGTASSTPASTGSTGSPQGDTTSPVVILNGAAAIQLTQGDTFTDPGATALDNVDGNLTAKIVETGAVDTAAIGLTTLTYSATDAAGNVGSASRVVTVIAPPSSPVAPTPVDATATPAT